MSILERYPSGNATFVFTDIEGSSQATKHLEQQGVQLYETHLRDPCRERLHKAVEQNNGLEVQRAGDGHMFVFQKADDALACVVTFQQSLAGEPITHEGWRVSVRIGVHTAEQQREPQRMENDLIEYPGSDTNYACRIESLAAGGQILISAETHRVARSIRTLTVYAWENRLLKSFDQAPQTVYEILYQPGQQPREPGVRFFPEFYEGERNRYVPRPDEEAAVLAHFTNRPNDGTTSRLVTIKAEGGMGKTRLAVACAVRLVGAFDDGVHFVSLALTPDTVEGVAAAIGQALGLPAATSRPDDLFQTLRSKNILLLLDNYESVKSQALARYLAKLVTETRGVSILAASRTAIGVADVEQLISLDAGMTESEARELFLARARLRGQLNGDLTAVEQTQLGRIVALTERIPLALELAAAWTEYRGLREIADGIEQTPLGRTSDLPPGRERSDDDITFERHHSLSRSLAWSYNLLGTRNGAAAQAVFAACSLFADSFTAGTVAAVSAEESAEDDLMGLQDACLVRRVGVDGTTRYRFHRFTRAYATQRLDELPTAADMRRRFIQHYVRLVSEHGDRLSSSESRTLLDREWRNAMAAASVAEVMRHREAVRELAGLGPFLDLRGLWSEMERLYRCTLNTGEALSDPSIMALALSKLGFVYVRLGRLNEAITACQRALAFLRGALDPSQEGKTYRYLGKAYYAQDRWDEATGACQRALAICRQLQDHGEEGKTLCDLGLAQFSQGRWEEAITTYEQSLAICRRLKDRVEEAHLLHNIAGGYDRLGRWEEAVAAFEQCLAIQRELESRPGEGMVLSNLGALYDRLGRWKEAEAAFRQSLAIQRELGNPLGEARALSNQGALHANQDRPEQAAEVLSQALSLCRSHRYRQLEGATLANLGMVYRQQGCWDEAIAAIEQALAICRELDDQMGEGQTLIELGITHRDLGHWNEALAALKRSLAIFGSSPDRVHEAEALREMALLWEARGEPGEALSFARQAVAALAGTQATVRIAHAWETLARLERAGKRRF